MALNELLIISIQTRLKGSLLIGHLKQEPLLVLHNCPPARGLPACSGGTVWGVCLSGAVRVRLGLCMPSWGCTCLPIGLYMHIQGCACLSGLVLVLIKLCMHVMRWCMPLWGCKCPSGVVHACLGLCMPSWGCMFLSRLVLVHIGLCIYI